MLKVKLQQSHMTIDEILIRGIGKNLELDSFLVIDVCLWIVVVVCISTIDKKKIILQ